MRGSTNYLKNQSSPVAQHLKQHTPSEIFVCVVVKAELLHGAMKYGNSQRRLGTVREALAPYDSLPFDDAAAGEYARIRHNLELSGSVIGPHDLFIAAICVVHECTLVTNNSNEFSRVLGLSLVDWIKV